GENDGRTPCPAAAGDWDDGMASLLTIGHVRGLFQYCRSVLEGQVPAAQLMYAVGDGNLIARAPAGRHRQGGLFRRWTRRRFGSQSLLARADPGRAAGPCRNPATAELWS